MWLYLSTSGSWLWRLSCLSFSALPLYLTFKRSVPKVKWEEETVLITGGSHGIGLELVKKCLKSGAKVVVLDVKPCPETSVNLHYMECDVSNGDTVKHVAQSVIDKIGHPTMLVNNAGIVIGKSMVELTDRDVERVVGINIFAHFHLIRAFLPGFISQNKGHILTVSSLMGSVGAPYMTDYCATKFAVLGMSEALRQELLNTDVQVSVIQPGKINTGMFQGFDQNNQYLSPELTQEYVGQKMFETLETRYSKNLRIPFYCNFAPLLQMLPVELNDLAHILSGANSDMEKYHAKIQK
ncbi:hypothetical protein EDD86DRAFT_189051 [Gorgonomyces haynaldii]|nr:hypothetical protein EDD86DRAFT_189051 [Gorgonomyces haynaldii]